MSRPASCSAVYGLMPATGSVVDFWKNSGTISTRPPTATTSTISTIIRKLLVSIFSWEKPGAGLWLSLMGCFRSGGLRHRDGDPRRAAARHRHPGVPGHHQHAEQVQRAAEEADHVKRIGGLHRFD